MTRANRALSFSGDNFTVFFIDHGDNETVLKSKLFHLDPKFFKLPCQVRNVNFFIANRAINFVTEKKLNISELFWGVNFKSVIRIYLACLVFM